jgi:hypothetical protein
MADQATYSSTVAVADPELARRKTEPASDTKESQLSKDALDEREEINEIIEARKRYQQDRKGKENEWTESYKMFMSWVDKATNPFLSNLFIPKTHEAVELLAAFLIGTNQNISASPENGSTDTMKARVAGKWLDFLWRKVLKARLKILVFIKQMIIFGNGVIKVGWDPVKKQVWLSVCALEDVYFDYYIGDIQDGEYVIHEIRRNPDDVKNDPKYDKADEKGTLIREQVIVGGQDFANPAEALFNTFDGSMSRSENRGKVLVMEVWCLGDNGPQRIKTLLPTAGGWRMARDAENPNKWKKANGEEEYFRPFVKGRFKIAALPNRAYDTGAVFPASHIQKAFNDLFRQYFDSVQFINNPTGRKRRGARINPAELVRRPGGVITMGDIGKDFVWDSVPDVKQSIIEMLNRLDREFQEASMVVNLVKGISQSNTATGDALAQQNVQTLLDMIDQNIVDALSELGQMVLAISLSNTEGRHSLVLYEDEKEISTIDFDPKNLDGQHDIRIVPDRSDNTTKAGQTAAIVKALPVIASDGALVAKYPTLKEKMIKRMLENEGIADPDYFFQEEGPSQAELAAQQGPHTDKVSISMGYKDVPDDVKREIESAAGLKPSQGGGAPAPQETVPSPIQPDASGKIPTSV